MNPPVTHDLFDESNGISSVGFIEEHNSVQLQPAVDHSLALGLFKKFHNILFCYSSMDLHMIDASTCIQKQDELLVIKVGSSVLHYALLKHYTV